MPFNLLILPLLGGFIFFSHWNRTAFFAKRQDKERLLLYSSLCGAVFLGGSFFLSILIPHSQYLMETRDWWAENTPAVQFSGISSFALVLGVAGQLVLNKAWPFSRFWNAQKEGKRVIQTHGTQLEKLLYMSLLQQKRVQLTLKNGKVYIGRVAVSVTPQGNKDLVLLPSKSGYRDENMLFIPTTDYERTYQRIAESETNYLEIIADFGVVIPIAEILTATLYRDDIHLEHFSEEKLFKSRQPVSEVLLEKSPVRSKVSVSAKSPVHRKSKSKR